MGKLQSNTSIKSGDMSTPRGVIIGRESLLHYEPNKPPGLLSARGGGKKGSSQDIAHSLHQSEKKVSMLERKPIQIKSKHVSGAELTSVPSFHISVQGTEGGVIRHVA